MRATVDSLVRRWAPLVWLAPGERFFPGGVEQFLENVSPIPYKQASKLRELLKGDLRENGTMDKNESESCDQSCKLHLEADIQSAREPQSLPLGAKSKEWFLLAKQEMGALLKNSSSFIHGYNPLLYSVPVYALVTHCPPHKKVKSPNSVPAPQTSQHSHLQSYWSTFKKQVNGFSVENTEKYNRKNQEVERANDEHKEEQGTSLNGPDFMVTYWLFFPFSEGKDVCVVETGPRLLGPWPLPLLGGHCLGKRRRYGSHLGDWEHLSIRFVNGHPHSLYISTHKLGAYYKYLNHWNGLFALYRHELREGGHVEGWLQRPRFPPVVHLTKPQQATPEALRPTLFAARGSHGLWAAPGRHQYVRYPRLEDWTGHGIPWATWTNLQILHHMKGPPSDCLSQKNGYPKSKGRNPSSQERQKNHGTRYMEHAEVDRTTIRNENIVVGEGNMNDCSPGRSDWPMWMAYEGHWGEPRMGCHEALSKLGVGGWSCQYSDGPRGIPVKRSHFSCNYPL
ncbi:uncharacterized protein [Hetaerina americana]|uniref:uncharacterized protein n=1 Tax=Hetaerina americana TaxID=62018 RepID=UPI003A7F358F